MKNKLMILAGLLLCAPTVTMAWTHANAWGGDTTHNWGSGSTTRTDAWGGSETHTYGQGTTATNRWGDTATHEEGSGQTTFTDPYGGSATHTYGEGTTWHAADGDTYHTSPYYGTSYYHPYYPPATVNYYGANCFNCGGWPVDNVAVAAENTYAIGTTFSSLPDNCVSPGGEDVVFRCGNVFVRPFYGANGVYYQVVNVAP